MNIAFYNSLSNQEEIFIPHAKKEVTLYSCGPTVYNYAHLGNFRSFLFSDLIHRTLKLLGYRVKLVMNITDVDDKTIENAKKNHQSLKNYTKQYIQAFHEDLQTLKILKASHYPKATDFIKPIIEMIQTLIKKKHAYTSVDGSVYFKLNSFPNYGKLSKIKLEKQQAEASQRIQQEDYSRDQISDFVLWKHVNESEGETYWESPFGKGRPGWHIECSAMTKECLGSPIDIHTGGIDNKFPHHENEIAQSECYHQQQHVHYWLHCAHLLVEGQKMSKSLNNYYTLRDLIKKKIHPNTIRYMLLSTHYRNHYNFTLQEAGGIEKAINKVNQTISELYQIIQSTSKASNEKNQKNHQIAIKKRNGNFKKELAYDLNTSGALREIFETISYFNKNKDTFSPKTATFFLDFFKMTNEIFDTFEINPPSDQVSVFSIPQEIKELVEKRKQAKAKKNWQTADQLRKQIFEKGYQIIDLKNNYQIKLIK